MNSTLRTLLGAIAVAAIAASCSRQDYSAEPLSYNGFMIDTTVYIVDTLKNDTMGPGSAAVLYSRTGKGADLRLETPRNSWPAADGTYNFIVSANPGDDTNKVSVCAFMDGAASSSFCMSGSQYLANGLRLEIVKGKWTALTLSYRNIEDKKNQHYLGINYSQK